VEPERRQVTILFADMADFTTFSERSGEEAAFTLMRSLSKVMDGAVSAQDGVVQSFTGDGIMAVFGAPVAFEDAPLRACRAALSILQRLSTVGPDLEAKHGVRPHLRIGLNTGTAVVGKVQGGADAGVTVLGDTGDRDTSTTPLSTTRSLHLSRRRLYRRNQSRRHKTARRSLSSTADDEEDQAVAQSSSIQSARGHQPRAQAHQQ
jgi:Adenylate and Guanylate cyclase catalytic domain